MRQLMRFYGFRKLAFVLAAYPTAHLFSWMLSGGPPEGWYSWPAAARSAVGLAGSGCWSVATCGWMYLLLMPLRHDKSQPARTVFWVGSSVAVAFWGLPGCGSLFRGVSQWLGSGQSLGIAIFWLLFRIALLPIGTAALLAHWPDLCEWARSDEMLRRLFVSGRGHAAGWLGPVGFRRLMRPLPESAPEKGGQLSRHLHLGQSLFESSYTRGTDVWLNEASHFITCARSGSGKFVASIAPNLAMYQGSGLFVSPKPELADFAVGRRTDQSLFDGDSDRSFKSLGVDPRGITNVRYMLPGGRSFVLDPTGQSVWTSSHHNILSEIDIRDPGAPGLINTIAMASFPDNPQAKDPFWTTAPRGLFAASIGHVLTTVQNPRHRNLVTCADLCMGIDPQTQIADTRVFLRNLAEMTKNDRMGGFIQKSAAAVALLGEEALGGVFAELERHIRWLSDERIRRQILAPSDFSYRELGEEDYPVSVFPVLPRSGTDSLAMTPWLRTHIELGLSILENKRNRPDTDILALFDEFVQYGDRVTTIRKGVTTLREAGVKLWMVVPSWPELSSILGEEGANGMASCCALEFFGADDVTAERLARILGKYTHREDSTGKRPGFSEIIDVITPAEVRTELKKGSSLKYVFPATLPPARVRRTAYKSLVTEEGFHYRGLPLDGHYDENLSQYRYARHRA